MFSNSSLPESSDGSSIEETRVDVAIIGAGFSGSMLAVHLLEDHGVGLRIALIEKTGSFAQGAAYGTPSALHLLNIPAGKMSYHPDQPDHFLHWLLSDPARLVRYDLAHVNAGSFVPRKLYGEYLRAILDCSAESSHRLWQLADEAIDVQPLSGGMLRIFTENGLSLLAREVVLALGNYPPADPLLTDRRFRRNPRYLSNPWSAETLQALAGSEEILLLGTGLTSLDLLLSLHDARFPGRIHMISRRGLLPQPHRPTQPWPAFVTPQTVPTSPLAALQLVRKEVLKAAEAGVDWRAVIDALRPFNQAIWQAFPEREKRRFLRHLRPYWETHRHRAAQSVLDVCLEMQASGQLLLSRSRLQAVTADEEGFRVTTVDYATRSRRTWRVSHIINCTGPEGNYHKLGQPLVQQLFARGLVRPDTLYLGLDADPDGMVINSRGQSQSHVHTLGAPQRGLLFETTAVPELRVQARNLADALLKKLTAREEIVTAEVSADLAYSYEI